MKTNEELMNIAKEASKNSYSPYSKFPVGACVLFESENVFSGCTNLTTIKLGKNIKVIGESNFGNVTDIYYEGTEAEWALVDYEWSNISDNVIIHYNYTPE